MKYDDLLSYREELLQAARLANLAYAHQWIGNFAARITRTGLAGEVVLRGPNPSEEERPPVLVASDLHQSVVDEHFLTEEVAELHNVLAFVHDASFVVELKFRLEELGEMYLPALQRALEIAEVLPRKRARTTKSVRRNAA
jgi:hypothetical protein